MINLIVIIIIIVYIYINNVNNLFFECSNKSFLQWPNGNSKCVTIALNKQLGLSRVNENRMGFGV